MKALEFAWQRGKAPHLLMSECLPLLDGRRMARRLVEEGVLVTLVYDAMHGAAGGYLDGLMRGLGVPVEGLRTNAESAASFCCWLQTPPLRTKI